MRIALLLAALTGCESGIAIEVRVPEGTTEVALFLATDPCVSCSAVRPPFADYQLDGRIFMRDGASITAPVDATGSAWFRFQPGELETSFAVVLAVGLLPIADDATYRDVSGSMLLSNLDVTGPRQVVIDIDPQTSDGPQAKVWESAATGDVCAAYVREDPANATVIVPPENPDCDGTIGVDDCDEFSHETNVSTPRLEDATCLTRELVPDLDPNASVCMIGGAADCNGDDPCQPTMFCAPTRACTECMSNSKFTCIAGSREGARIVCDVPVIGSTVPGRFEVCDRDRITFSLETPQCSSIDLALVPEGTAPDFRDKVSLDTGNGAVLTVLAKVPDPGAASCEVELGVEGTYLSPSSSSLELPLVARIRVPNLPVEGAVVPLVLNPSFVPDMLDCETNQLPLSCHFEPGIDIAAQCLGARRR